VCKGRNEAIEAVHKIGRDRQFGDAGNQLVIEERLDGQEASVLAITDGRTIVSLPPAQDHKAAFDGDTGPNTGGMGAYSPTPLVTEADLRRIEEQVLVPTVHAMKRARRPFRGVLYAGLMMTNQGPKVLEFNVRFGDPECETMMMRLESDLAENLLAATEGKVANTSIRLSPRSAVAVVLASGGYPGEYKKGIAIKGLDRLEGNVPSDIKIKWAMKKIRVKVFHAGTVMRDGQLVTDGGRVLTVTAMAPELATAVDAAYEAADMLEFEGRQLRRDIARRALG
jgi:phosphoribosylamine--glycine ligase